MNERTRYQKATAEGAKTEQQEKLNEAMTLLEQGIDSILDSEGFAAYLKTMARFHNYSFRNVLMILAQRPEATQVAGYKTWQTLSRQVRKGEKGLIIFVPHKKRVRESPDPNATQPQEKKEPVHILTGYGLGRVFDISQTDGDPLPEPPEAVEIGGESETGAEVDRRLSRFLIEQGMRLTVEDQADTATWCWQLEPLDAHHTRLLTWVRMQYHWTSPKILFDLLVEFTDIIMMRKCLLGIRQRSERASSGAAVSPTDPD